MKFFKTDKFDVIHRFEINQDNFLKETERKFPFEQTVEGNLRQYAICSSCNNPIQLIGVMGNTKYTPHGKHTGKDIVGLPPHNGQKYIFCPYAKKDKYRPPNKDERLTEIDDNVRRILHLLKTEYDRVVYVISVKLQIRFSPNFLENALKQFLKSDCYLYPWLTASNLPFIFAYFGIAQKNPYGQSFHIDSEAYRSLSLQNGVLFVNSENSEDDKINTDYRKLSNSKGEYFEFCFRFTDHIQRAVGGEELKETMVFAIDNKSTGKTLFKNKISFDETFF